MIVALVALLICLPALASQPERALPPDAPQPTLVKYYGKNVFDRVNRVRARQGYRIRYDVAGYASRPSCKSIGQVFWLRVGKGPARLYQQTDCSRPGADYARHVKVNQTEIDYRSAQREGLIRVGKRWGMMWE